MPPNKSTSLEIKPFAERINKMRGFNFVSAMSFLWHSDKLTLRSTNQPKAKYTHLINLLKTFTVVPETNISNCLHLRETISVPNVW